MNTRTLRKQASAYAFSYVIIQTKILTRGQQNILQTFLIRNSMLNLWVSIRKVIRHATVKSRKVLRPQIESWSYAFPFGKDIINSNAIETPFIFQSDRTNINLYLAAPGLRDILR